jgi:electron-transferring-flavoprotein dehydrogenase
VSVGIFVPSWMSDPSRTAYRYLQHYIQHPALWVPERRNPALLGRQIAGRVGKHGEPFLSGDGFARIGEGSGSTNMLTGSGVDEAWATGTQLAEAVIELLRAGKPFTQENLAATYEARRRASWVERGAEEAKNARNGFHGGIVKGMIGMAPAGLTGGKLSVGARIPPAYKQIRHSGSGLKLKHTAELALADGRPLHDALLTARGWPEIPFDGHLLVTQQDALLLGGKVQAMPGFPIMYSSAIAALCKSCLEKTCIAMCSGQAITTGCGRRARFEREKCIHCGACLWNCGQSTDGEHSNIEFRAGAGRPALCGKLTSKTN